MRMRPATVNATIAWLFVVGSSCFVLGATPLYADAVGASADSVTFFVGSIFFTAASFVQLLQAQTPAMTDVDEGGQHARVAVRIRAWRPRDPGWLAAATQFPGTLFFNVSTFAALAANATAAEEDRHVWRPDVFGSTLFLAAGAFGLLAVSSRTSARPSPSARGIAWLNMIGSVFFMASAVTSYVLPATAELLDAQISSAGTLLGALCFLVAAALMFSAWRAAVQTRSPALPSLDRRRSP
jgi:hypothetical protein